MGATTQKKGRNAGRGPAPDPDLDREPRTRIGGSALLLGVGLACAVLFWILGVFDPATQRITGVDPVGYYAWLRSAAFDGDLDFENEYRALVPHEVLVPFSPVDPDAPRTATGRVPNVFSLGPGLLWAPFVALGHLTALWSGAEPDGYSQPYHTAVFLANMVYGMLGALLMRFALRRWFGPSTSTWAAAAAWTCSPALYYTFAQEAMSHACSFFAMALFFAAWLHLRDRDRDGVWAVIGAALGFAALMRWQNATFAVIPAIDLLARRRPRDAARLALCAAATLAVLLPQMLAWRAVYGSMLTIPQGPGFVSWARPELLGLFFSRRHGLLTWTPLCGAGIVGLFFCPKERRIACAALGAALLLQCYVSACAGSAGWTFGMRRLVNCAPVFAVGFAALLTRIPQARRWACAAAVFFAVWNFLFILQYGGFLDTLYVNEALHDFAREHNTAPNVLLETRRLPGGAPFDLEGFVHEHRFPKETGPSFRQFVPDKLTVLVVLARRLAGLDSG